MSNPVFQREWKMRWRNKKTMWLMLAYATALAVGVAWIYNDSVSYYLINEEEAPLAMQMSEAGRRLFSSLSLAQLFAWLLLSPALTATGLSRERERGLLESVQLSLLSPRQVIIGHFRSVLSFFALLLPISLPVTSICLLLGGVSPSDIAIVTLLQFVSAMTGSAIGLFFAARSRRVMGALIGAYVFGGIWLTISFYCLDTWFLPRGTSTTVTTIMSFIGYSNPYLILADFVKSDVVHYSGAFSSLRSSQTILSLWILNVVSQLLIIIALLEAARKVVSRPLPPLQITEQSWSEPVRRAWRNRMERMAAAAESRRERASLRTAQRAGEALLWEIPLHKLINFKDPILRREVWSKFRWRGNSWWMKLWQLGAVVLGGFCFIPVLYSLFDPPSRPHMWWFMANVGLGILAFSCCVMGATSLTRERESGTWEGLQLSVLRPRDVLRPKLLAPLIACFYYALPFLIILILYIRPGAAIEYSPNGVYSINATGVPPTQAIGTFMVVIGTAVLCVSIGLFVSSLCERVISAVCWTFGAAILCGLFLWFVTALTRFAHFTPEPFYSIGLVEKGDPNYYNRHIDIDIPIPVGPPMPIGPPGTAPMPPPPTAPPIIDEPEEEVITAIPPGFRAAIPFFIESLILSAILLGATCFVVDRKMRMGDPIGVWLDKIIRTRESNIKRTNAVK